MKKPVRNTLLILFALLDFIRELSEKNNISLTVIVSSSNQLHHKAHCNKYPLWMLNILSPV